MSMQRYPRNPIEARKSAVRTYSRNAAVCVGGGVVGGGYYWSRIRKIVNHKDQY